jgi:hypothetical protein
MVDCPALGVNGHRLMLRNDTNFVVSMCSLTMYGGRFGPGGRTVRRLKFESRRKLDSSVLELR